MKASLLAKLLLENPDADVVLNVGEHHEGGELYYAVSGLTGCQLFHSKRNPWYLTLFKRSGATLSKEVTVINAYEPRR